MIHNSPPHFVENAIESFCLFSNSTQRFHCSGKVGDLLHHSYCIFSILSESSHCNGQVSDCLNAVKLSAVFNFLMSIHRSLSTRGRMNRMLDFTGVVLVGLLGGGLFVASLVFCISVHLHMILGHLFLKIAPSPSQKC